MVRSLRYMILLLLMPVCSSVANAQIGVSLHDTSGIKGSKLDLPVYVDSSLAGSGVISYSIQMSYDNNYLAVDSVLTSGSMSASWGMMSYNKSKPGVLNIAASASTPLSGTGILLKIRFTLVNPIWYTTVSLSKIMFNEGVPAAILHNGNISISAMPSISVSPNSGLLTVGDQLQFYVSGGVSPYLWSVTDTTAASINGNGLLTAKHGGFMKVIVKDGAGIIDTMDGVVEIRSFRLSIRDTSYIQGHIFDMPIYTTDLTGLNVTSGSIKLQFDQNLLTPLQVVKEGTIISTCDMAYNISTPGQVSISFASSIPLSGTGVLMYIRFKVSASQTGTSAISQSDVVLNQSMLGNVVNGYFHTINLSSLSVSPNSATLISGDTLRFNVTGGTVPYTWWTSDSTVATINSGGLLTALKGGMITVHAQDMYGATSSSGNIDLYDTRISLPDTTGPMGDYVDVPIYISPVRPGIYVSSVQATIAYDTSIMKAQEIISAETLTSGWLYSINIAGTQIIFAAGTSSSFSESGIICWIRFAMSSSVPLGWRSALNIQKFVLNEGNPKPLLVDGSVTVSFPVPPILITPINGAKNISTNPTLTWNGTNVTRTYRVQVSTDSTFTSVMVDSIGLNTTSVKLAGLASSTKYYWRVNVTILGITTNWSSVWDFTTISLSSPQISVYPRSITFGNVGIYDSSKVTVKITNGSVNPLIVDSVYTRSTVFRSSRSFSQVTNNDTALIIVTMKPIRFGSFVDTLFIQNNSDTSLIKIPLSGNTPVSSITVSPAIISFGTVKKDSTHQLMFTITNSSISVLQIDSLWTKTKYFNVTHMLAFGQIRIGDTTRVTMRFTPDAAREFIDTMFIANNSLVSPLKVALSGNGILTSVTDACAKIPQQFELMQNYPNPFNPSTLIRYALPERSIVRLQVFNMLGQVVAELVNTEQNAGNQSVIWNANVTGGVYLYRISTDKFQTSKKMILLK